MLPSERQLFSSITAMIKDGSSVTLRLLEPSDVGALGDFYESVPRGDYRHYAPHRLNRAQAKVKAETFADSATFICIIALNNKAEIVGYGWCDWKTPEDDRCGLGICVRSDLQCAGVGKIVMQQLLDVVRQAGPPLVHLTVNKANTRALSLYQKMGFAIVREQMRGRFEEFPAEPEYYMEQKLR